MTQAPSSAAPQWIARFLDNPRSMRSTTGYYWDNNYGNWIKKAGPSNLGFLLSKK
jgi:hypothetical protein